VEPHLGGLCAHHRRFRINILRQVSQGISEYFPLAKLLSLQPELEVAPRDAAARILLERVGLGGCLVTQLEEVRVLLSDGGHSLEVVDRAVQEVRIHLVQAKVAFVVMRRPALAVARRLLPARQNSSQVRQAQAVIALNFQALPTDISHSLVV